ncbi:MAG: 1,4-beta-xylanase [Lachnospiraceae bacterium]|nr:1,4-beta-xylanase [Lachnospiraceae bacterium]
MDFIKGITFAAFAPKGSLETPEAKQSLRNLAERTNANFVILVLMGLQDTPQSEDIDYRSDATVSDRELAAAIRMAKDLGLRVALKPTVNCRNGVWRAHINFFDEDVPCEPKWSNWFRAYTDFQLHYAEIAQREGCEMFLPGCEMVQSERREQEWRQLIGDIRKEYGGLVSYNTDKYQEHNVKWWDAVDVISSSGYYPVNDWERQLDRIEAVVQKFDKPFFFAECGCMSTKGSDQVPNDWNLSGDVDLEGQADWYRTMFAAGSRRDWVGGYALWDWSWRQYSLAEAVKDKKYDIYGKPAEQVVAEFYGRK